MKLRFFWQLMEQIGGLLYASIRYDGKFPDKDTYVGPVEYSLPFHGKWAVVNGGIDKETSHSWDIYPQRYAYDFLILDDMGNSYTGDEKDLNSYYCYGREVLAPADGFVVEVYDCFGDCRIIGNGKPDKSAADLGGNRVVIQHAEHEFSVICHLMPKSIAVKAGQRVQRGCVIGRCGNSGNTTEPHIHFQLQNKKKFYSSLGLPVRFKSIRKYPTKNYEKMDPRPLPNYKDIEGCYIARGMTVENGT
jgi:hypothetical protein